MLYDYRIISGSIGDYRKDGIRDLSDFWVSEQDSRESFGGSRPFSRRKILSAGLWTTLFSDFFYLNDDDCSLVPVDQANLLWFPRPANKAIIR